MKKLTVRQRIKIYREALKILGISTSFLCIACCKIIKDNTGHWYMGNILDILPELAQHQPDNKHDNGVWFPVNEQGLELRKSVLEWCIRCAKEQLHQKGINQN